MTETKGTKSIHRAIDILEVLAANLKGISLAELAQIVGVPKPSVHRILHSLIDRQLVREDPELEKFTLGMGVLRLSQSVLAGIELRQQARPVLENLNLSTDETVHLGILDNQGPRVIYIDKIESSQSVRLVSRVGQSIPVHCTALGKALLSGYTRPDIETMLANYAFTPYTPNTITSMGALLDQLELVRSQGYAVDEVEHEQSVICVASPILDGAGRAIAAVSISAPVSRLPKESISSVGTEVRVAAEEISEIIRLFL